MRFHAYHDDNIQLMRDRTVALRKASFAQGIVFSERRLAPNELFLVEIDRNENGWSGYLRLGLTSIDPDSRPVLPISTLPYLNRSGRAWVFAMTRASNRVYDGINGELSLPLTSTPLNGANTLINADVVSEKSSPNGVRLPIDVGSQVGVYYRLSPDGFAQMHFVVNGVDRGPSSVHIPWQNGLFALVDVYGSTKQVRIVQRLAVSSLQHSCQICILKCLSPDLIDDLPLPSKLKTSLKFLRTQ